MESKQIDVTCPCCETVLTVDVLTAKVLRSARPRETDETGKPVLDAGRWDAANKTVTERGEQSRDAFESALDRERDRASSLDDLFDKAKKKALDRRQDDDAS